LQPAVGAEHAEVDAAHQRRLAVRRQLPVDEIVADILAFIGEARRAAA